MSMHNHCNTVDACYSKLISVDIKKKKAFYKLKQFKLLTIANTHCELPCEHFNNYIGSLGITNGDITRKDHMRCRRIHARLRHARLRHNDADELVAVSTVNGAIREGEPHKTMR